MPDPRRALAADLDMLQHALFLMAASGYGDLLGEVIAGADTILSDELGIEAIHPEGWGMVMPHLARGTHGPDSQARAELDAIENLVEGLVMAGSAMQTTASTRPTAGSEHLYSHL